MPPLGSLLVHTPLADDACSAGSKMKKLLGSLHSEGFADGAGEEAQCDGKSSLKVSGPGPAQCPIPSDSKFKEQRRL